MRISMNISEILELKSDFSGVSAKAYLAPSFLRTAFMYP